MKRKTFLYFVASPFGVRHFPSNRKRGKQFTDFPKKLLEKAE
jgi:hypothetical protein